jgi:hypothetical protein
MGTMNPYRQIAFCLVLGVLPLAAQTLESIAPEKAAVRVSEEQKKQQQMELLKQPSRYAAADSEAYVEAVLSRCEILQRDRDPFGRHQDPNYKPPKPVVEKKPTIARYKPEPVTPFSDIVAAIPITAVIPAQSKFLVGGRAFSVGSQLKLNIGKDEPLTVHVVGIDANRVTFRHGDTNEVASHALQVLPGGVSRGTGIIPAGVIPTSADDTIDVSSATDNTLSSRR